MLFSLSTIMHYFLTISLNHENSLNTLATIWKNVTPLERYEPCCEAKNKSTIPKQTHIWGWLVSSDPENGRYVIVTLPSQGDPQKFKLLCWLKESGHNCKPLKKLWEKKHRFAEQWFEIFCCIFSFNCTIYCCVFLPTTFLVSQLL